MRRDRHSRLKRSLRERMRDLQATKEYKHRKRQLEEELRWFEEWQKAVESDEEDAVEAHISFANHNN